MSANEAIEVLHRVIEGIRRSGSLEFFAPDGSDAGLVGSVCLDRLCDAALVVP